MCPPAEVAKRWFALSGDRQSQEGSAGQLQKRIEEPLPILLRTRSAMMKLLTLRWYSTVTSEPGLISTSHSVSGLTATFWIFPALVFSSIR